MPRYAAFTVNLSKASTDIVTVDYKTVPGTATSPTDFIAQSGTLSFAPGEVSKEINIIIRNAVPGTDELDFSVVLMKPVNCTIGTAAGAGMLEAVASIEGPIIEDGLITNSYADELGRGGYFHYVCGTSEGQAIGIMGCLLAYEALRNGSTTEITAANWYLDMGLQMLDALGDGNANGPMLRQPVPTDVNTICLLHWLFPARGDVPAQGCNYRHPARVTNGTLIIPEGRQVDASGYGHNGAEKVYRVWQIYPQTSSLLYSSPYSASYDNIIPGADTSIGLDDGGAGELENASPYWEYVKGVGVVITLPKEADTSIEDWYVVYGYEDAGTITRGSGTEAYPFWTPIEPSYSACAPDTFRWFNYALQLATQYDTRPGKAAEWEEIRLASNRSCVRGQAITDLREILKPLPQFQAIPVTGEPSGMFCYSDHPLAAVPTPEQQAAGANVAWSGFNFWSRVGGSGGKVQPAEFTWTPANMFTPANWHGDIFNGALQASVPADESATVRQVQIGRGLADSWRVKTPYQEADQYMFIALTTTAVPDAKKGESFQIYLSATQYYDESQRWMVDLTGFEGFTTGNSANGGPRYFLIPREKFLRINDGTVLPAGQTFFNFGVVMNFRGTTAYNVKIVAMRLVGGESAKWVTSNYAQAVQGSAMPFFPGALPFAINAYLEQQQFVGWNGSPFHGYQQPDLWYHLGSDAKAVHPLLTVKDLPVPNPGTGAIEYPIRATTSAGIKKAPNALLLEQQIQFLKHAQDKYFSDSGTLGPFAHTWVINTPARMSIGNPTPSTWVYTNDDPNTKWIGYQVRPVESLARLCFEARQEAQYSDSVALALRIALNWLEWLDTAWPNLKGTPYTEDGVTTVYYGMPTLIDDPRKQKPTVSYEEPHAAAIALRACMWLKMCGKLTDAQLTMVQRVGVRCWQYMNLRWRADTDSPMLYTWATTKANGVNDWYGFWHFEIISTLALTITYADAGGLMGGLNVGEFKEKLSLTWRWLDKYTEKSKP